MLGDIINNKTTTVNVRSGDKSFTGEVTKIEWDFDHWAFYIDKNWYCQSEVSLESTNIDYWKQRCLLAEQCLKESPCDPDVTSSQIKAHDAYNKFLEIFGNKL